MSILDTFFLVFETDTKNVEKGTEDARKSAKGMADELLKTGEAAGAVGGKFMALVQQAGALAAAYFAVTTYANQINETVALGRAAETLGDAVEDVDAFGRAAVKAGGDAQGALDSLTDISEKVGEALQDTESQAAKTFAGLGIKLKDTQGQTKGAVAAMMDLAGAVQGLSREEAIFRIKELGVTDNRTVDLLLKGRAALEGMMQAEKAFGVVTKQDAEVATKFKEALSSTSSTMGLMVTKINTTVLPAITWTVEAFRGLVNFLGEHKTFVMAFFAGVAAIVSYIYVPAMVSAAMATLAAAAPFLILGAALAALAAAFALVYDDIVTFMEGGDSMIGRAAEKWPILGDIVRTWVNYLGLLRDVGLAVFGLLADLIMDPANAWDNFTSALQRAFDSFATASPAFMGLVSDIGQAFTDMGDTVTAVWDAVIAAIKAALSVIEGAFSVVADGYDKVKSLLGFGGDDKTMQAVSMGQQAISTATATPLASQSSTSIANTSRQVNRTNTVQVNGPITVQTQATDAAGISQGISGALGDQLGQVTDHFDDGVAY